ncbi:ABC-type transport system substrate-binding protein [Nakamurella sp. UYEF19]|uniref:ABC transporter family substrate-binding protein n=1 Tax=Nakamurella sp. UYEF19 TaxID=1756392 RepID=UPI003398DF1B
MRRKKLRRRPLRASVLALVALLLAACTPPGLPAPIAPASSAAVGTSPATASTVTIGVDGLVEGFNPHAIADYSPADAAVASLVLPSVSTVAADGSLELDRDVVRTAVVTSTDPFTVTYTLDRNASWSDGTPITAEDFSYLRDQMLVQPGTVDPAGYRMINAIVSRDAGKSVEVTFSSKVADWMALFSPLLPAHILKDSPGGWTEGLAAGIPVSGNRYKMQSYDTVTGEITLVRNDKYWGTQPGPSTAILRLGTTTALIEALRRGDLQAVLLQPDAANQRSLDAAVPTDRRVTVPLPGAVQLVFNTTGGAVADVRVRRAIAAGLDLAEIRAVLDGGNAGGSAAVPSLIALGSTPPQSATPPSSAIMTDDAAAAAQDLEAAGYHRDSLYVSKDGQVLRLTLTYPSTDPRLAAAAGLVQSRLAAIGIEVDLLRDEPRAVVDNRLARGTVDLGLLMVPRGPSDAIAADSAFGCPLPVTGTAVPATDPLPRAGNLSGFCSEEAQAQLADGLGGVVPVTLDGLLASELPIVPIGRQSAVFATSARIAPQLALAGPGWVFSGPLAGLAAWPSD